MAALFLLAGTAVGDADSRTTADRSRTLIVGVVGAPLNLDPVRADNLQNNLVHAALYDRLVTYTAKGLLKPSLAEKFTVARDAKSISVTLRRNVRFHDGSTLTAGDVAYSLDRAKRIGQGVAGLLTSYRATTVRNSRELTINLTKPDTLFAGALSKLWIVNSRVVRANAGSDDAQAWLQSHDAGSGPYTFGAQQGPDYITNRYGNYWGGTAGRPESLAYRLFNLSATQRDAVRTGSIDVALNLSNVDAEALKGNRDVIVAKIPQPSMTLAYMNVRSGATANPTIRKALQLAYDYNGGLNVIRAGNGSLARGVIPNNFGCKPTLPQARQNLAEARRLLQRANLNNVRVTLRYQPNNADQVREATLLQSNLKEIGVTLDLVPILFPDWLATLTSVNTIPEMMLVGDAAQYPDPGSPLTTWYRSSAIGTTNRTGFSNARVDALIDRASRTVNDQARCELYKQAQRLIFNSAPAIFMYTTFQPVVYHWNIKGVAYSPTVRPIDPTTIRLP